MPAQSSLMSKGSCAGFESARRLARREVLSAGALWGLNLSLPSLFRSQAARAAAKGTFGRAKAVILLFLNGGNAQQETWDPKPDAPYPARGDFKAISTSLPGIRISELLPRSAALMHKMALIRSLSHRHSNHIQASLPTFTGHSHPDSADALGDFPPSPSDFPPFGAVLDHLRTARRLPTWVQVGPVMRRENGTLLHGQFPGFLGSKHGPLVIDQDLVPALVQIKAVSPDPLVPRIRLDDRHHLQEQIDHQRRSLEESAAEHQFDEFHDRAFGLLTSPATAQAFRLAEEPTRIREAYGLTPFGQDCVLARRLVEAGVPMITVHYCRLPRDSWDTHYQHASRMKNLLCPTFDQAYPALLNDLDERGLLGQTLVLALTEFGRTPQLNRQGGRDHWPWVYSIALAGGGVAPGVVYGSSDRIAARPTSQPHDPGDLAATIYHLLGVPAETQIHDPLGRPHPLVIGKPIDGVLL
jgi:uncharacterized protein (DUF1501 family)